LRLAAAYSQMGRYAEAYQALQRSLEINNEFGVGRDLAEVKAHLGCFLSAMARFDEAEQEFLEAEAIAHDVHAEHLVSFIELGRARLQRYRGRLDQASESVRSAMERAEGIGQREEALLADLEQGYIQLSGGSFSAAEDLFTKARSDASRMGARPLEAEVLVGLAETYVVEGDFHAGYDAARAAASIAEGMTLRPVAFRALQIWERASTELGRADDAAEASSRTEQLRHWLGENLMPEDVEGFLKCSVFEIPPQ